MPPSDQSGHHTGDHKSDDCQERARLSGNCLDLLSSAKHLVLQAARLALGGIGRDRASFDPEHLDVPDRFYQVVIEAVESDDQLSFSKKLLDVRVDDHYIKLGVISHRAVEDRVEVLEGTLDSIDQEAVSMASLPALLASHRSKHSCLNPWSISLKYFLITSDTSWSSSSRVSNFPR